MVFIFKPFVRTQNGEDECTWGDTVVVTPSGGSVWGAGRTTSPCRALDRERRNVHLVGSVPLADRVAGLSRDGRDPRRTLEAVSRRRNGRSRQLGAVATSSGRGQSAVRPHLG